MKDRLFGTNFGTVQKKDKNYQAPIFKVQKRNLPKNYNVPNGLKTFLSAIKSEILDPRNRNQSKCNLSPEQISALKELIKLQRERKITIKACDKGAGIIILNFKDYMIACYKHLYSRLEKTGNLPQNYYQQVDDIFLQKAKVDINLVLEEALLNQNITKAEFQAMDPTDCDPARFYCNFKVHKEHSPGETPDVRPIISGSGSTTENIGKFVEHHIKHIAKTHEAFLEDTPDFLQNLERQNQGPPLPPNACLVTADIQGAYQNIPQEDGVRCLKEALDERKDKEIPSDLISTFMELILKYNLFEFHGFLHQQRIGTAISSKPAPPYANIYLSRRIDKEVRKLGFKFGENGCSVFQMFKRFLDDLFLIYRGPTKQLHILFNELNQAQPTLKFTFEPQLQSQSQKKINVIVRQENLFLF